MTGPRLGAALLLYLMTAASGFAQPPRERWARALESAPWARGATERRFRALLGTGSSAALPSVTLTGPTATGTQEATGRREAVPVRDEGARTTRSGGRRLAILLLGGGGLFALAAILVRRMNTRQERKKRDREDHRALESEAARLRALEDPAATLEEAYFAVLAVLEASGRILRQPTPSDGAVRRGLSPEERARHFAELAELFSHWRFGRRPATPEAASRAVDLLLRIGGAP